MSERQITLTLTEPERDIIIAALRHWQASAQISAEIFDIAENDRDRFLSDNDIDDLIETKINT